MTTLLYKRTHPGDPDARGVFGCQDCMGRMRDCDFDSVIGIGGIGGEAQSYRIEEKINWIGVGANRHDAGLAGWRGSLVTFEHFLLFEEHGPDLWDVAPHLALRMLVTPAPRSTCTFDAAEQAEIDRILAMAASAPASPGGFSPRRKCRRRVSIC